MDALNTLLDQWRSEGLVILPPAPEHAVREAFESVGSYATQDVIKLYSKLGGMEVMDNALWRLWSLAEIQNDNTERSTPGVLFSDYLMNCWCYRLKPTSSETSAVVVDHFNDQESIIVAKNLAEFFAAYLKNPRQLLDAVSHGEAGSGGA